MLVSDLIYKVKNLSGFQSQGSSSSITGIETDNNKVIEAINSAQKQLAKDQFRGFIQTISLTPHHLFANDKYLFLNNDGWSSNVTSNTISSNFPIIPTREMETRPLYFYEEGNYNSSTLAFNSELVTRYPNEFSNWNGVLIVIDTHTITPYLNLHFPAPTLNTFKISFNVYMNEERRKAKYKFDIILSESAYVLKRINNDLTIVVDFSNMKISYLHSGKTKNTYVIEYLSYPYGRAGACLLYNGNVRRLNADTEGIQSRDMQIYAIPYSIIDPSQNISEIISGDSEILEYFIYECAYQLQLSLRDIDSGLAQIREEKRAEYININNMKIHNNHAYFPTLP